MSETVFKQVNYDLNSLANYIELGEIGLPDIQRPFVWKNAKVGIFSTPCIRVIRWVTCCSGKTDFLMMPMLSARIPNKYPRVC